MSNRETLRIAALGDLHYTRMSAGMLQSLFAKASEMADVLLLLGDLTDYGLPEEARLLAHDLRSANIPILAVLGNHDYETGQEDEVKKILRESGVNVLDGEACEVHGVGFVGAKGFCGGFGRRSLEPWGEVAIKSFVQEALEEALKLEKALARLRTRRRIALLHYAPIKETCEGEPLEIYPFLGSARLEEPLNRYRVSAVFHGHVHRGTPEGRTTGGVPVYNVALPLLRRLAKESETKIPPLKILEVDLQEQAA